MTISLSVPNFIGNEAEYAKNAVESGWVSTGGAMVTEFENRVKNFVGSGGAAACQNGTSGLHLALLAVGVKAGDEVLVPALTFIAAVNPVKYCNAEPVFMDCGDDLCMDMEKVERFLTEECILKESGAYNKKTNARIAAMIPVHVFGNICDMEKAVELAEKFRFRIVEDATEALGSYFKEGRYCGKFAGTIGDVGVYSFNGNKIITTGGGGMVVSESPEIAERVKYLSTQAKDDALRFVHNSIGYNYRLTNVQAALGVAQMEVLERFIQIKNDNYDAYLRNGIELLPFQPDVRSNKWFYSYPTEGSKQRDGLITHLKQNKIESRPIWALINELPMYRDCQSYQIENARYFQERIVNLPCSTSLTEKEIEIVCGAVKEYDNH